MFSEGQLVNLYTRRHRIGSLLIVIIIYIVLHDYSVLGLAHATSDIKFLLPRVSTVCKVSVIPFNRFTIGIEI